ncbi:MAG: type II toxin-antitoxin system RelE/ParE family toxin [Candidatus Thiodiazotropha sp.]
MRIEYTDVAIHDLIRLRAFIAEHNPQAANKAAAKLTTGIRNLTRQPRLGHPVMDAPDPEKIRDLILPPYTVRYTLMSQSLLILRIWHHKEGREDESTN